MATNPPIPLWHSFEIQQLLRVLTEQQGVPLARLLEATGVSAKDLVEPGFRLTLDQELELYTHIAQHNKDPYLGIRHGQQLGISRFGMLGQAMLGADTVHQAILLAVKYTPLISWSCELSLSYEQLNGEPHYILSIHPTPEDPFAVELETDSTFASLHTVINEIVMEKVRFHSVYFSHPSRGPDSQPYRDLFQCPVNFGAQHNKIILTPALMSRKLPYAKPEQAIVTDELCKNLVVSLLEKYTLVATLKDYLLASLTAQPSIEKAAAHFNISSRTLRRRLSTLDYSYQEILDEVRFFEAKKILGVSKTSFDSIALVLGYKDVRSFRIAFKRWSGMTPSSFRNIGRHREAIGPREGH